METFNGILEKLYIFSFEPTTKTSNLFNNLQKDCPPMILTLEEFINTLTYTGVVAFDMQKSKLQNLHFKEIVGDITLFQYMEDYMEKCIKWTKAGLLKDNKIKQQLFILYVLNYLTPFSIENCLGQPFQIDNFTDWNNKYFIWHNIQRRYTMREIFTAIHHYIYVKENLR